MAYPSNQPDPSELENLETPAEQPKATLENIVQYATRYQELETEADGLTAYIKTLEKEMKEIEETHLPQIFNALGVSNFGLKDGSKVVVEPTFQGSVVVEDHDLRGQQISWLIRNEGQDIIKNTITCTFPKGNDAEALALRELLKEYDFSYTVAETVHAGTLGSFIKSKIAAGDEVPLDLLHWRYFQKAKIKPPAKVREKKGATKP